MKEEPSAEMFSESPWRLGSEWGRMALEITAMKPVKSIKGFFAIPDSRDDRSSSCVISDAE